MKLSPFRIERYYARYEFTTRYMLSSSDCESRTIAELLELEPDAHERLLEQWCGYTESPGAPELREAIAALYSTAEPDDVIVASCAEEGIFLLYHALLGAGDHAIVETPCYESALQLARSTGADVSAWRRRYEDGWAHDLEALERLIAPDTRVIYINQPHNPTGTLMDRADIRACRRARPRARRRAVLRRGLPRARARPGRPAARRLRPVRAGRVAGQHLEERTACPGCGSAGWPPATRSSSRGSLELKDYTTICSSAPSELLSALALRHRQTLIDRNLGLVHHNLQLLEQFISRHRDVFAWVRPTAGPIGFPRVRAPGGDVDELCRSLAETPACLLLPERCTTSPATCVSDTAGRTFLRPSKCSRCS